MYSETLETIILKSGQKKNGTHSPNLVFYFKCELSIGCYLSYSCPASSNKSNQHRTLYLFTSILDGYYDQGRVGKHCANILLQILLTLLCSCTKLTITEEVLSTWLLASQ